MNLLHSIAPELSTRLLLARLAGHVWAARPENVETLLADIAAMHPHAKGLGEADAGEERGYAVTNRKARIGVRGMMYPTGPKWLGAYFALCEHITAAIRSAEADSAVDELVLEFDTPGGSVLGVEALGEVLAGAKKPTTAYVLHQCSSAGYWVASQAKRIVARPGAYVGSIGAYCVVADASKAATEAGLKVHVIRAGWFKGAGTPGAALTDQQLAEFQARVDCSTEVFRAAVARGRGLDAKTVEALATGQEWHAAQAKELGLIDEIEDMRSAGGGAAPQTSVRGSADTAAQENDDMTLTKEQAEALQAELAQAKAREAQLAAANADLTGKVTQLGEQLGSSKAAAAAMEKSLAEVETNEKAAILDEGVKAGRVTPATRPEFEAYAKTVTPDALRGFVAKMPVVTRPTTTGSSGGNPREGAAPATGADAEAFAAMEVDAKQVEQFGEALSVGFTGNITRRDGTTGKAVL